MTASGFESTGISGSLRDVSVADVLQFIYLGRRTGTLRLARAGQTAAFGFADGALVSGQTAASPRLGEVLVTSAAITRRQLEVALEIQKKDTTHRAIGQILLAARLVRPEALRKAMEERIRSAVADVLHWDSGEFDFVPGSSSVQHEVRLRPGEVLPATALNTQAVLLEASRIFDERNRPRPTPPTQRVAEKAPSPAVPPPQRQPTLDLVAASRELERAVELLDDRSPHRTEPLLSVQVVSRDARLASMLQSFLGRDVVTVSSTELDRAGVAPGGQPPIVLLDLRDGSVPIVAIADVRGRQPGVSLVALAEGAPTVARAYAAGATAVAPAEITALAACMTRVFEAHREVLQRGRTPAEQPVVVRLQRALVELRSGTMSATMALSLMHTVSESVLRAILFLVAKNELAALGAFGRDANHCHLALRTRGLRVPLAGDHLLNRAASSGEVCSATFEEARLPSPLPTILGRPRTGQTVAFPVAGAQSVIAVIYADNGESQDPIHDFEILELATAQAGIAFENELLRRRLAREKT